MRVCSECIECLLRRHLSTARSLGSEEQAAAFARDMMRMLLDGPEDVPSPYFAPQIAALFVKHYNTPFDRYTEEKALSNRFAIEHMEQIRKIAATADDPLYAGLQLAILGNYLDFSALQGEVDLDELNAMLLSCREIHVDRENFEALRRDLAGGRRLLYLTDNAGEIGFDRVFAEQIHRQYPNLQITFCVRGGPALNDALREDAQAVGIAFPVIDNGSLIPGTLLDQVSDACRQAIGAADVIFAKGQANVETLLGCGLNVYYAFLVKCVKFQKTFGKPRLTPMLHREML